jgi:hypothetical protein
MEVFPLTITEILNGVSRISDIVERQNVLNNFKIFLYNDDSFPEAYGQDKCHKVIGPKKRRQCKMVKHNSFNYCKNHCTSLSKGVISEGIILNEETSKLALKNPQIQTPKQIGGNILSGFETKRTILIDNIKYFVEQSNLNVYTIHGLLAGTYQCDEEGNDHIICKQS